MSKWFKGKELAFALGFNISVSRLGSVINGIVVPEAYDADGLGFALLVGLFVCIASLIAALCLVYMDRKADQIDGDSGKMITEEDKFKFKDLKTFNRKFWLISASCVITYSAIFPFI